MAQSVEWILTSEIFPSEIISCKKFSNAFFVSGNHPLDYIWCSESENDSPDGQRQSGGEGPSNRLSTTVCAKNRYQNHIWYDESENHPPDEQQQRGGEVPSK